MLYIKRDMEETFLRVSSKFKAVLLTGPRQVGKNDDDDEKSGKLVGNGGSVCLHDDFLPLNKDNFVIPIRCV